MILSVNTVEKILEFMGIKTENIVLQNVLETIDMAPIKRKLDMKREWKRIAALKEGAFFIPKKEGGRI